MSTGIIATAIVLIIGYVIVSRIVGLAFRLVIPLVLLVILGGAGVFSDLMPERSPTDPYAPYGQVQHRPADISDLRLRDITDMASLSWRIQSSAHQHVPSLSDPCGARASLRDRCFGRHMMGSEGRGAQSVERAWSQLEHDQRHPIGRAHLARRPREGIVSASGGTG